MKPLLPLSLVLALALSACSGQRVRAQSLYFRVHHAALFTAEDGRGAYVIEIQSIRNVPELSTLRIELERPGRKPWTQERTVGAGQRRWQIQSPPFEGFEPDAGYWFRLELIAPDRFNVLDRLRQKIEPTLPTRIEPVSVRHCSSHFAPARLRDEAVVVRDWTYCGMPRR